VIYQVTFSNANEISGKAANKPHVCLFCYETSVFFFISTVFQYLESIWLKRTEGNLHILISQARPRSAFNQFHGRKCLFACIRRSETTHNSGEFS